MVYFEQAPCEQLKMHIDKYWYCQIDNLTNATLSIPFLHHELVFNFSDDYNVARYSEKKLILQNSKSWITGIQTSPVLVNSAGKHEMAGVLFKPSGLKAFTNYHSNDFTNYFVDSTLVFDKTFRDLVEKIESTQTAKSKITLIENYLIQKLNADNSPQYLKLSLKIFDLASDKKLLIRDICHQLSISNKSLIKAYQKHIGLTPVKYVQLQSINKALHVLSKEPQQSLTKLAYDLNFYDQSHFINSFKETTSMTPSHYIDFLLAHKADHSCANFISI